MKILIIQTAFIGDVVLATPLVESLKGEHPEWKVDFLLRQGNEPLLDHHPLINNLLIFNKKENKYRNLLYLIKAVRQERYDYVINVQRFFSTGLITVFSGGNVTIGFRKNPLSMFFSKAVDHLIQPEGGGIHEVDRNLALIASLVNTPVRKPKLYPGEKDFPLARIPGPYVCVAPASVWFTKQLPQQRWIELIRELPEDITIYLIGSTGDHQHCEQIRKALPEYQIENLAGKLTFLQSAALIGKAKMTFANDSAPLHFASAMNAPVAAVFCSTVPGFGFGPLSDVSHILEVDEKLSCRPCGLHGKKACPEGHFKCSDIRFNGLSEKLRLY